MPADQAPLPTFRFRLEIAGIEAGAFSEVSGLTSEYEVVEYREGSDAVASVRKLPGLRKFGDVTLKRGIAADKGLWEWHDGIAANPSDRRAVTVSLLGAKHEPVCRWKLRNAWPAKYEGPVLDADSSMVAIETLVLAHEGLDLDAG
jgi:phage tail-like protein